VKVIGLDLDEAKLRIAAKYEHVVKADACCLPFKNSCFDGVLASHILEHVSNDLEAMREIYRVLRGGGILVAESPTPWHGAQADSTHLRSYDLKSFRDLAKKAGFKVLSICVLGRGIPGFGKLKLYSASYRIGNFLSQRLHILRGFVFMICQKPI
jgi:ubiquinone/menaquinone biosynthesis C-methylase UbiE